ncbi:MAG TPA: ABC transporter permease [Polyangiaceae bacterium]|nr:ABC transporter permease [Polyangiaceae bacterium]
MRALEKKLFRELGRLKGQIASIALVLASGIVCFMAMHGTSTVLGDAVAHFYDRYRFGHVFAHLERAPETAARRVEQLPGVEAVEIRLAVDVTVPIEGMSRPAYGRMLSLPGGRQLAVNALQLQSGRLPEAGKEDEVVLLDAFAQAHGLAAQQRVPVVINGKKRSLRIVGIALSPEFIYSIRPGALVDDPKRHAVLWMDRAALASAFQLSGAFNDVSLRLAPEASEQSVRAALDRILAPYGGTGSIGRKDQLSNRIVTQELGQLNMLSTMVPAVFLGVTMFLVHLVLGRLIRLQRPEIATLKALGYSNRDVGLHYLGLVLVVLLPGGLLGLAGGQWLGRVMLGLYGQLFRIPDLTFRLSVSLVSTALLASAFAAVAGALGAVRSAVRLPPAEAMQPPAPARYRRGLLERLGLKALAGTSGMMIVREVGRRPFRTLLSSLGIAGAISLMILGRFGLDSLMAYFEGTYGREQRQDVSVQFARPVSPRVVGELRRLPGIIAAEGLRAVPIRVHHGHRARDSVLMGIAQNSALRRLVGRGGGSEIPVPPDGVVLTKTLAEVLGVHVGDRPEIELREGARHTVRPLVVGTVDDTVGLTVYGQGSLVASLEGDSGAVSSVLLRVDPHKMDAVYERLRRSPEIIDASESRTDMHRLLDMNASFMNVWTAISIALSASIVFGVVYNNARIGLAARSRDLASLRVLGFTRGEISLVLLGSQAIEVMLALPLGLWLGTAWARLFMSTVDQETFRWSVVIAPSTYLFSTAVAVLAAAGSALWVRRNLDNLDLVSALKARE